MNTYHIKQRGMLPGTIKASRIVVNHLGQILFYNSSDEIICVAPADSFVKLLKIG
jgi:hypothetical protein